MPAFDRMFFKRRDDPALSERMPCQLRVMLHDGCSLAREKHDYHGFFKRRGRRV